MGRRRRICWCLLASLCLLARANPAHGAVEITVSEPDPAVVHWGLTESVTFQVDFHATRDESFALGYELPAFGMERGVGVGGSPLQYIAGAPPAPGLAPTANGQSFGVPACSPAAGAPGSDYGSGLWDVELPEGETISANFGFEVVGRAPWPDTQYAPTFLAQPELALGGEGTLERRVEVDGPAPGKRGPRGVHIRFRTRPVGSQQRPPRVSRDRRIEVRGTTRPRLRRKLIGVVVSGEGSGPGATRTIPVRTRRSGSFRTSLRLRRTGLFEIRAEYRGDRRTQADSSCGTGFRATR